jgi:predicted amidohydrolase YtcJ
MPIATCLATAPSWAWPIWWGARSWAEAVERVREQQRCHPTPWALGRGWDQNAWPGQAYPTRERLDQAFQDQPVMLVRVDGHAAVANGAALVLAGLDEGTRVPGGDLFQAAARLTGVLIDNAIDLVKRVIPPPDRATREEAPVGGPGQLLRGGPHLGLRRGHRPG